jgi:hypothetical protein
MPLCVNPDHLFLGTQADNQRDMRVKNRHAPSDGPNNFFAKLEGWEIPYVRNSTAKGVSIAAALGVSADLISKIRHYKVWRSA